MDKLEPANLLNKLSSLVYLLVSVVAFCLSGTGSISKQKGHDFMYLLKLESMFSYNSGLI